MRKAIRGCTIAALMVGAGSASAGGLWLNEYGDFAGGRAAAGAAAGTDEAMTLAYNPASITALKGNQLFVSAGALVTDMKFDTSYTTQRLGTDNGGDAGGVAAYSSMAYVHDFDSERWSAGIGLVPLSGAGIDYGDNWVGRFQATDVDLTLMALTPTLAYKVTDKLSLGATVQAYYADLEIKTAVPRPDPNKPEGRAKIDGDDVDAAFTLGAMYELSDRTRFGLFYQSELEPHYNGHIRTNPANLQVNTDLKLTFAEYVRFAVHQDMDERWGVDFTVGWDNWSALGNVPVDTENGGASIATKWEDTYHVGWGAQYKLDNYWTLTGGVAYDGNPVSPQARNAQLPVDEQVRYAGGARYALSDTLSVGGYVNYADLGKARISSKRWGGDFGDANSLLQLVANVNWTF
jgi:long-chain fatty acid transport protein